MLPNRNWENIKNFDPDIKLEYVITAPDRKVLNISLLDRGLMGYKKGLFCLCITTNDNEIISYLTNTFPNELTTMATLFSSKTRAHTMYGRGGTEVVIQHFENQIENIHKTLVEVAKFDPCLDVDLQNDIFDKLNLRKSEKEISEEVMKLYKSGNIDEAIKKAVAIQTTDRYYNVIVELISQIENDLKSSSSSVTEQNLYDLCGLVDTNNPHYKMSNEKKLTILQAQNSNEHDQISLLEEKLTVAIYSQDYYLAGIIFHELCGEKGQPSIKEIKGDPETLFTIAAKMREMNIKIQELSPAQKQTKPYGKSIFVPYSTKNDEDLSLPKKPDAPSQKK